MSKAYFFVILTFITFFRYLFHESVMDYGTKIKIRDKQFPLGFH